MPHVEIKNLKPKASWYFLALVIALLGPAMAYQGLKEAFRQPFVHAIAIDKSVQEITVTHPGRYTFYERPAFAKDLFNQNKETFAKEESAPFHFMVLDAKRQPVSVSKIEFNPWLQLADKGLMFYIGRAHITFKEAGKYIVTLIKPPKSTFVLAQNDPSALYQTLVHYVALAIISLILGPLLLLAVYFLRQSNRRLQESPEYQAAGYRRLVKKYRLFATTIHLGGLFGYVFPLGHLVVPMLVYVVTTDKSPLVKANLNSVLNFQISMSIYLIITITLAFAAGALGSTLVIVLFPLIIALALIHIILTLLGVIISFKDGLFFYPFSFKFLSKLDYDEIIK